MTSELFNNHPLLDFNKLSINDSNEINHLQNAFETNGWCFIRLSDQSTSQLDDIQTTLSTFFAQDQLKKVPYKSPNAFGYSRVGHKEGIKVLINQHGLANHHHPLSNDVEQSLQYLAILLNHLTNVFKSVLLTMPIFAQSPTKETVPLSPLGMLDIVHYFNERTGPVKQPKVGLNTHEVNCVPHFDPGLFSLSLLSTCDGLQLHDQRQDLWIDGPNNSEYNQRYIGVIWLGEAASILTENRLKSGVHRVVYPRTTHQARLTIWQEVCTVKQIERLLREDDKHLFMSDGAEVQLINQPQSSTLRVQPGGESLNGFMKRVEDERGLSMSKSGVEHLQIRFPATIRKESNSSQKKRSFFSRFFN